jgi:hypothetical protein
MVELGRRLLKQEDLPKFEPVELTLDMLMAEGEGEGGDSFLGFLPPPARTRFQDGRDGPPRPAGPGINGNGFCSLQRGGPAERKLALKKSASTLTSHLLPLHLLPTRPLACRFLPARAPTGGRAGACEQHAAVG